MITFDANGVATQESQAFFEQKRLAIINDPSISDAHKGSKLRDLYNQYGMEFGTYNRKNFVSKQETTTKTEYTVGAGGSGEWFWIFFCGALGLLIYILGYVDIWFKDHNINFSFAKLIENFFQMLFS